MTIPLPHPPRRIVIVKPSALGDIVHTLPVVRLLRRRFPAASLAWVVNTPFAPLLAGHPDVDEVIRFDRRRPSHVPRLAKTLADGRFDLAIDFQGLFRSGWMVGQTRAPVRTGVADTREGASLFQTHRILRQSPDRHAIERYLDVVEALGCERGPIESEFGVTPADREAAAALLGSLAWGRPFAVLLPGTNWATKRWPAEHFDTLAERLRELLGLASVLAGGQETPELRSADIDLRGKTSIRQLVAVLERAAVVVTNDSGPMHLAAALRRPTVALFGPTSPIRTGPYADPAATLRLDLVCAPCLRRHCVHRTCLRELGVEEVVLHARRRIAAFGEQIRD